MTTHSQPPGAFDGACKLKPGTCWEQVRKSLRMQQTQPPEPKVEEKGKGDVEEKNATLQAYIIRCDH